MLDVTELHRFIDQWAAKQNAQPAEVVEGEVEEVAPEPARELPKDKRAVRTKTSGDRVYILDEKAKTRRWVTNPDVLKSVGFELSDVVDVDDSEFLKYQMGPALYKAD